MKTRAVVAVLVWSHTTFACSMAMFSAFQDQRRAVSPPSIESVDIRIERQLSTLAGGCLNYAGIVFKVRTGGRHVDFSRIGLKLRLIEGSVLFRIPERAVAMDTTGRAIESWSEDGKRARPAFHGRVSATLVSSDGKEGPSVELSVAEEERPTLVYVHPFLSRALRLVSSDAVEFLK